MEKFAEVTQENIFGNLWTRPGLDLKTRAMITVISDASTGRTPELIAPFAPDRFRNDRMVPDASSAGTH